MLANLTFKNLFLIDSLGALTTAFLLGVVLVRLESIFGMPPNVLYSLAAVAVGFMIYSLVCYQAVRENWQLFLRAIAIANLLYCVLTLALVIYFWADLTMLGVAYFFGEAIIVTSLALIELKIASQTISGKV